VSCYTHTNTINFPTIRLMFSDDPEYGTLVRTCRTNGLLYLGKAAHSSRYTERR